MEKIEELYEILKETTVSLRKGAEIEKHRAGNVEVTEIFVMPHESEVDGELEKIDCHFITVGVDKTKAKLYRDKLVAILKTYPNPERLAGGPSYIEVGRIIGDQGAALQLFALGEVLELWKVITPETLGFTDAEADQMAGRGLVMISGFKEQ